MTYTAKIEQTFKYKKRMRYLPATDSFEEKDASSLAAERDFVYPSGWIKESGTPLSFLQSMLMGYSVTDREHFRFNGSGGSISKYIIEPDGRVICCYLNHRIF